MKILPKLSRRATFAVGVTVVALFVGAVASFEPLTRNVIARDALCTYCHIEQEYIPTLLVSAAKPHPMTPEGGRARCVDCHLPEGFWATTFAYTHFVSLTDLFGHLRNREAERDGDWIPPRAATAHRVRDRLFEFDSVTCRSCHLQSEIRPASARGRMAHKKALDEDRTCIECHYNMAHRQVELRIGAFARPGTIAPEDELIPAAMVIDIPGVPDSGQRK